MISIVPSKLSFFQVIEAADSHITVFQTLTVCVSRRKEDVGLSKEEKIKRRIKTVVHLLQSMIVPFKFVA